MLNGEENAAILEGIVNCSNNMQKCGLNIIQKLDALLVIKKQAEYEED